MKYRRQVLFFGKKGQRKLRQSTVLLIGLGGLGSSVAYYLTAAGIKKLIIVDYQPVEESNLNRQILHFSKDVGILKVISAQEKLQRLNPDTKIEAYPVKITKRNVSWYVKKADVVVDGLDNFETRFIVNNACVKYKKPYIFASVEAMKGMLMSVYKSACLSCVFRKIPETKKSFPIVGATAGTFGCLEALETIKILTKSGKLLRNKMLVADFFKNKIQIIEVKQNPKCKICSK